MRWKKGCCGWYSLVGKGCSYFGQQESRPFVLKGCQREGQIWLAVEKLSFHPQSWHKNCTIKPEPGIPDAVVWIT